MQPNAITNRVRQGACAATLLVVLGVAPAHSQCTITGPAALCGGSAELCGPDGPYFYEWQDPSGNLLGDQRCLTVTAPGTYLLSTFDYINGLAAGPCTHVIGAASPGAPCTITGDASVCEGASAALCGPEGAAEYQWSGPNGFAASSRCIEASAAGLYQVQVRSGPEACWSAPCEQMVSIQPCGERASCPLPPWVWQRQVRWSPSRSQRLFDPAQMAAIAACVDARSARFSWSEPSRGLRHVLENRCDLQARAHRQLAGVLANVCAHQMELQPRRGPVRGLAPSARIQVEGYSGTVAEWVASAEARLLALGRQSLKDRKVKDGYRSVIRVGWMINHGIGLEVDCTQPTESSLADEMGANSADMVGESLAEELSDDAGLPLVLESMAPNPMAGSARIVYVVTGDESEDLFLGVFDVSGRMIRELARGRRAPGRYEAAWDGRDGDGNAVRNGAYFVMGRIGSEKIEGRLILMR